MKNPIHITTKFLSLYAGLLAIQHGIFEILQGEQVPAGVMINAIGLPCQPEQVWHACYPAMTLIPNMMISGILATIMGMGLLTWGLLFSNRRYSPWIFGALAIAILLVGGGFVPVFITLVTAVASMQINTPPKANQRKKQLAANGYPWILGIMTIWFFGSWILGAFFNDVLLSISFILFFVFDIGLPILAVIAAMAARRPAP